MSNFDIATVIRRLRKEFLKEFRKELGPSRSISAINSGGCAEFESRTA